MQITHTTGSVNVRACVRACLLACVRMCDMKACVRKCVFVSCRNPGSQNSPRRPPWASNYETAKGPRKTGGAEKPGYVNLNSSHENNLLNGRKSSAQDSHTRLFSSLKVFVIFDIFVIFLTMISIKHIAAFPQETSNLSSTYSTFMVKPPCSPFMSRVHNTESHAQVNRQLRAVILSNIVVELDCCYKDLGKHLRMAFPLLKTKSQLSNSSGERQTDRQVVNEIKIVEGGCLAQLV